MKKDIHYNKQDYFNNIEYILNEYFFQIENGYFISNLSEKIFEKNYVQQEYKEDIYHPPLYSLPNLIAHKEDNLKISLISKSIKLKTISTEDISVEFVCVQLLKYIMKKKNEINISNTFYYQYLNETPHYEWDKNYILEKINSKKHYVLCKDKKQNIIYKILNQDLNNVIFLEVNWLKNDDAIVCNKVGRIISDKIRFIVFLYHLENFMIFKSTISNYD